MKLLANITVKCHFMFTLVYALSAMINNICCSFTFVCIRVQKFTIDWIAFNNAQMTDKRLTQERKKSFTNQIQIE